MSRDKKGLEDKKLIWQKGSQDHENNYRSVKRSQMGTHYYNQKDLSHLHIFCVKSICGDLGSDFYAFFLPPPDFSFEENVCPPKTENGRRQNLAGALMNIVSC